MDQLTIETIPESQAGIRVLKLPFTLPTIFDFQAVVRENPAPLTIIEMSGVPYMDSAALGAILGFHAACQREGRRYGLVGASDRLKTLFEVVGVRGLVHTYASMEEVKVAEAG